MKFLTITTTFLLLMMKIVRPYEQTTENIPWVAIKDALVQTTDRPDVGLCLFKEIEYFGVVEGILSTASAVDCYNVCSNFMGCNYFTWIQYELTCILMQSRDLMVYNSSAVSGIAPCREVNRIYLLDVYDIPLCYPAKSISGHANVTDVLKCITPPGIESVCDENQSADCNCQVQNVSILGDIETHLIRETLEDCYQIGDRYASIKKAVLYLSTQVCQVFTSIVNVVPGSGTGIISNCFVVEKERPPSGKVRPLPPEENLDCNMPVPRHCETTLYQGIVMIPPDQNGYCELFSDVHNDFFCSGTQANSSYNAEEMCAYCKIGSTLVPAITQPSCEISCNGNKAICDCGV